MDLGSTNKTFLNVSNLATIYSVLIIVWIICGLSGNLFSFQFMCIWQGFYICRRILLNLNDIMNYLKRTRLSLVTAGKWSINARLLCGLYCVNYLVQSAHIAFCRPSRWSIYCDEEECLPDDLSAVLLCVFSVVVFYIYNWCYALCIMNPLFYTACIMRPLSNFLFLILQLFFRNSCCKLTT